MAAPNIPSARNLAASIQHLKRVDPILAVLIDRVGDCTLEPRREGTHFDALLRAIVYQQLSGKAAATIHGRVVDLFGGRAPAPSHSTNPKSIDCRTTRSSSGSCR